MPERELTEEAFNTLLSWLDPDREAAGRKYEAIRRRLIVLFDARGCEQSEELADEALDRFTRRLPEMLDTYEGDPLHYVQAIARNLYLEYLRKRSRLKDADLTRAPAPEADEDEERLYDCLERCLDKLEPRARALVLDYYRRDRQSKIDFRKRLAEQMGIAVNALRIRVHRLRNTLHDCLEDCLGAKPAGNGSE